MTVGLWAGGWLGLDADPPCLDVDRTLCHLREAGRIVNAAAGRQP